MLVYAYIFGVVISGVALIYRVVPRDITGYVTVGAGAVSWPAWVVLVLIAFGCKLIALCVVDRVIRRVRTVFVAEVVAD